MSGLRGPRCRGLGGTGRHHVKLPGCDPIERERGSDVEEQVAENVYPHSSVLASTEESKQKHASSRTCIALHHFGRCLSPK